MSLRPLLAAAVLLPWLSVGPPRAAAAEAVVVRVARSSVDAAFVPDPADASRDLVTGRRRDELQRDAERYYESLAQSDPARFRVLAQRAVGEPTAAELDARARAELAAGRPAAAQLAWERLVEEYPDSAETPGALVRLASMQAGHGDRPGAERTLAKVSELDLQSAAQAAPLMARLLAETEERLAREGQGVTGRTPVRLGPTLEARTLDEIRTLSEWTSGWALLDEVASTLRIETSGDLLRRAKNAGADALDLDALTRMIPREERETAVRAEEQLRDPSDRRAAEERAAARTKGKLDRWEDLARVQQLQVVLLARALGALEVEPPAAQLGSRTVDERRANVARLEAVARDPISATSEEHAVARLLDLADADRDGRLTPLWDDEGLWRPKRLAVEGDMRNARDKPLDDDNAKRTADLFERTGMSEKGLFVALVRASTVAEPDGARRVDAGRVDRLLAELLERGRPVHEAAHPGRAAEPGEIERDYLARLCVLRLPGESLDDVLRRELVEREDARLGGDAALAQDPEAAPILAELASLGRRTGGAWVYEDDAVATDAGGPRTAEQKLERAQVLRAKLDDIAARQALSGTTRHLVADLESQGMRFSPGDLAKLEDRVQHEDLGTLALTFDGSGAFTGSTHVAAFTTPGTKLGDRGPGHLAYGFGLDATTGTPAGNVGWRDAKDMSSGSTLSYHFGALGVPAGAGAGASAQFRKRKVWQPEVGLDAAVLRGFGSRGFLNLARNVNLKHQRKLEAVFADHEAARAQGRAAFVGSLLSADAAARPAALFASSLGYTDEQLRDDPDAYRVLRDSYEVEKARRRSEMNRDASLVRFGGWSFNAALMAGDIYLLGGPRLALKDYKLYSHYVDGPVRRVQSEEAQVRRVAVDLGPVSPSRRMERLQVDLDPKAAPSGESRVVATNARVELLPGTKLRLAPDLDETPPPVLVASRAPLSGLPEASPRPLAPAAPDARDVEPAVAALNRHLASRGVPVRLRPTGAPGQFELVPSGLTPWCAQSIETWIEDSPALALSISPNGLPLLAGPPEGGGLVVDWLAETRVVPQSHEADELHRIAFSLAPGRTAAEVFEGSAYFMRTEVVNGRALGTVRLATRTRDEQGRDVAQSNVLPPGDGTAAVMASAAREARALRWEQPEAETAVLRRPLAAADDGTISDPAALSPALLDALALATPAEVRQFKDRSIEHARLVAAGSADSTLDPDNVAYIQSKAIAIQGRPLSGEALDHAYWVLVHEGLYRADGGPTAQQVAMVEERAISPFSPGREIEGAPDARTRRLMEEAGVDERAALDEVQAGVRAMAAEARRTGSLPRETVPAGTRILTASEGASGRGVQWTTATDSTAAHLLPAHPLDSNTGRYLAALSLGPELPALDAALRDELRRSGDLERHPYDLDRDLVPALGAALRDPVGPRTIRARVAGMDLDIVFAQDGRSGALARCKNATLFPPAWGAKLTDTHPLVVAAAPVAWVGAAESAPRIAGRSWTGWRFLSLLAGIPLLDLDDGGKSSSEPPDVVEPPGREGAGNPTSGRGGRPDPPTRPDVKDTPGTEVPRDGTEPPDGGRNPRPRPPGRPDPPPDDATPRDGTDRPVGGRAGRPKPPPRPEPPPPEEEPPRDGREPPDGGGGRDREPPPEPPDRPRRPVD